MFEISQTNMIILLVLSCVAYYWITNKNEVVNDVETVNDSQNNEVELNNKEDTPQPESKKCDSCDEDEDKKVDNTFQPVEGSAFDTVSSF